MKVSKDGNRPRLYHERVQNEERAARQDPVRYNLARETRSKLATTIGLIMPSDEAWQYAHARLVMAVGRPQLTPRAPYEIPQPAQDILAFFERADLPMALSTLEAIAAGLYVSTDDTDSVVLKVEMLQAVLKDELVGFRYHWVGSEKCYQIDRIDNEHLHREIVDRTFELTSRVNFGGAQSDYADARRDYVRGDYGDALAKCGNAYESAMKAVLDRIQVEYGSQQAAGLAQLVFDNGILPTRLQTLVSQLLALFRAGPNTLRNMPGAGHGSAQTESHDAAVANLALNLTGSLIVFLAEAWERHGSRE